MTCYEINVLGQFWDLPAKTRHADVTLGGERGELFYKQLILGYFRKVLSRKEKDIVLAFGQGKSLLKSLFFLTTIFYLHF